MADGDLAAAYDDGLERFQIFAGGRRMNRMASIWKTMDGQVGVSQNPFHVLQTFFDTNSPFRPRHKDVARKQ